MTDDVLDYSRPGPFTSLDAAQLPLIEGLPDDPVGICAAVQSLVIQPTDVAASGISEDRIAEKNIRPVNELVTVLTALDPAPLHQDRTPETRVVGTCRQVLVNKTVRAALSEAGDLTLCCPRGRRFTYTGAAAAMWVALCEYRGHVEPAAERLAFEWMAHPPTIRAEMEALVASWRDLGLVTE
ncbi:hypothetical protein AB0F46_39380 [Streptomyces sp. NPDC026665]|uniref:hypothetical protein n=1 Tax=Streptomyces sp. NPDC026665 TaxID=3154798 RepID=UPI0033DED796